MEMNSKKIGCCKIISIEVCNFVWQTKNKFILYFHDNPFSFINSNLMTSKKNVHNSMNHLVMYICLSSCNNYHVLSSQLSDHSEITFNDIH